MQKEWFIDRYCGQKVAALLEDGQLVELTAEKEGEAEIVGNIYKGKIANVLTGMQAAFVSCGLAKNAYLSTTDGYADYSKYDEAGEAHAATPLSVNEGDEVLVQVVKPQRGNKGAKVTTQLSFVGRTLIYLPSTPFYGISRKITDETDRERLLNEVKKLTAEGEGFIIRTKALSATSEQLFAEYEFLKEEYRCMLERAKTANQGEIVYRELELPVRVVRDDLDENSVVYIGDKDLYNQLSLLAKSAKELTEQQLRLYDGKRAMMSEYGISSKIYAATNSRVQLENGGYIVIDHTEAMTVIDVNSGSFIGSTSLEETALSVNLVAAKEIARQVRLRNVGGIVVVDFIDMLEEGHKLAVTAALEEALLKDKTKCNVLPMNELCLTQFTRKRVGHEALEYLVKPCKHCEGNGHVHTDIFTLAKIRDELLQLLAKEQTAVVHLNESLCQRIVNGRIFNRERAGAWQGKNLYFIPHKTYPEEDFNVKIGFSSPEEQDRAISYEV